MSDNVQTLFQHRQSVSLVQITGTIVSERVIPTNGQRPDLLLLVVETAFGEKFELAVPESARTRVPAAGDAAIFTCDLRSRENTTGDKTYINHTLVFLSAVTEHAGQRQQTAYGRSSQTANPPEQNQQAPTQRQRRAPAPTRTPAPTQEQPLPTVPQPRRNYSSQRRAPQPTSPVTPEQTANNLEYDGSADDIGDEY